MNPDVPEVCNGRDDDCDGEVDEGVLRTFYPDLDGDGFGAGMPVSGCVESPGLVANATDCDDTVASTHIGAPELCDGIVDDDCDGAVDDGCVCVTDAARACGAAVGVCTAGTQVCIAGRWAGCDGVGPGTEVCNLLDDDCDGTVDEGLTVSGCYRDYDADGFGAGTATVQCTDPARVAVGGCPAGYTNRSDALDCNDRTASINPEAFETCNGIDDDCNGDLDDVVGSGVACTVGLGECRRAALMACLGAALACVGTPGTVHTETCNGLDDDCNGTIDDGLTVPDCRTDLDGDGFGVGDPTRRCIDWTRPGFGLCPPGSTNNTSLDCNDTTTAVRPTATEVCNLIDDDCDGVVDDGVQNAYFRDADGDAYGTGAAVYACFAPSGYVVLNGDCNDARAVAHPGATELCDGVVDDNCNGNVDETCLCTNGTTQACSSSVGICTIGTSTCLSGLWGPCSGRLPVLVEVCDGLDQDCDGVVDEGVTTSYYPDADHDGYGRGVAVAACAAPAGYVSNTLDCNDASSAVHPGAVEMCNGADDNCNGTVDDMCTCIDGTTQSCGSAVGVCSFGVQFCVGTTWTACSGAPPHVETCNTLDDDCNGTADDVPAVLTGLSVSCGALGPVFGSATTGYLVTVQPDTTTCTFTPTFDSPACVSVTVGGASVASGATSAPLSVPFGETPVPVVVTTSAGGTRTYTVTLRRAPSCAPTGVGRTGCGLDGTDNCCASPLVPGGTFYRFYDGVSYGYTSMAYPATVSDYRLDKYEITVGRFRSFVTAWDAGWRPAAGAGKHTHLNGGLGLVNTGTGGGYEAGWSVAAGSAFPTTEPVWSSYFAAVVTSGVPAAWTGTPGSGDARPINYISPDMAQAFCIWDGGFLPSLTESNYAAAGGSEQRAYPWSVPPTPAPIDAAHAVYSGSGGIAAVGTKPAGNGRWGQADISGNVVECTADYYVGMTASCVNCFVFPVSSDRAGVAGGWVSSALAVLSSAHQMVLMPNSLSGARCARSP